MELFDQSIDIHEDDFKDDCKEYYHNKDFPIYDIIFIETNHELIDSKTNSSYVFIIKLFE